MKVNLHNKVEIFCDKKFYVFYNQMFDLVIDAINNFRPYFSFAAIGNGEPGENKKTQKLSNFIEKRTLKCQKLQNNVKNGQLYSMKSLVLNEDELGGEFITELGICEDDENNPDIYNYITLISNETPDGIEKKSGEKMVINLYIYLEILSGSGECLCEGENQILSWLLGEGLAEKIYAVKDKTLAGNLSVKAENFDENEMVEASVFAEKSDKLLVEFSFDLPAGETEAVSIISGKNVVAKINALEEKLAENLTQNFVAKNNAVVDLGSDVRSVLAARNLDTNLQENGFEIIKFAKDFAGEIKHNFPKSFNYQTARFLSKDGKLLFYVENDFLYGYRCENYQISVIFTGNLFLRNIKKIVSFDDVVLAMLDVAPYVVACKLEGNSLRQVEIDFASFELFSQMESLVDIDAVAARSGKLMIAMILSSGKGATAYFDFDSTSDKFVYDKALVSNYDFSFIAAMHKTARADACVVFAKGGEYSHECRTVSHKADGTLEDQAGMFAYDLTHDTSEIYVRGRAIVAEKTTSPKVYIYYYPEMARYNLPVISNEVDNHFSAGLLYLVQRLQSGELKTYNLVGYNEPTAFASDISNWVQPSKVENLEFFGDYLLLFLNDSENPIVMLALHKNCTMLDGVSAGETEYEVNFEKYDKLGKNGKKVRAKFALEVSL